MKAVSRVPRFECTLVGSIFLNSSNLAQTFEFINLFLSQRFLIARAAAAISVPPGHVGLMV